MTHKTATTNKSHSGTARLGLKSALLGTAMAISMAMVSAPAFAQQAGTVNGRVTSSSGAALSGVTVEARSPVLPGVRTATSSANGRYQLPFLPPGEYELTFRNSDGTVIQRQTNVLLDQKLKLDVQFVPNDEVVVVGSRINLDTGQASLKDSLGEDIINSVPIGQEYRDLQKLIVGAAYTEDGIRGPSVGGSGQDNIYQFDGVDVTLPLFGTLAAEPSTHDISQVSIVRGGAKAVGFNRSGGVQINSVSKSGTNEFHGEVSYRTELPGLAADADTGAISSKTTKNFVTVGLGGPILKDKLFFYGSYFRPTVTETDRTNNTGESIIDFKSKRDEFFGKLTFAPTSNLLLNASYRTSSRSGEGESIGDNDLSSTANSGAADQDIITADGSWVIDDSSSLSFKFTDYSLKTAGLPDTQFGLNIGIGDDLPIAALDQSGFFRVPTLVEPGTDANGNVVPLTPEEVAFNTFAQGLVGQYGAEGLGVGGGPTINNQDFFRTSYEIAYDKTIIAGDFSHELHFGYQYQHIAEDLDRLSNGFGSITAPGGLDAGLGSNVFFVADINQMSLTNAGTGGILPPKVIRSESKLHSFEFNDTIETGPWEFNLGVVVSKDILFGQGLRENPDTISGFEAAIGNKYKMHATRWRNMIQPRFGVRYQMTDQDSLYANFARYNPPASSLARAASWARNLRRTIRLQFDQNGDFVGSSSIRSSSGKLFQEGIKPRFINEYLVGWDRDVNDNLTVRLHGRFREGGNFWEDTNNTARLFSNAPADIAALGLYIPRLNEFRNQIGSGSSYVIAQLDTAYTDYYEAGIQAEYTGNNFYLNGSYVWSEYTGNFDQDNTTQSNDANTFIGSSFLADGFGRQVWDNREGKLRGDIPHKLKLFGYYDFSWNGRLGAFAQYQSGQPWEARDGTVYGFSPTARNDRSRYGEPAGSRRTDSHFQVDLSYTQMFEILDGREIELRADVFNVFNKQTGYNIQDRVHIGNDADGNDLFGTPRDFYDPRRVQLTAKARF